MNQGTFQTLVEPYDIDTLGWDDNLYKIKIRAEDVAGHVSEKWFIFWIDTSPPSISLTSPVNGGSDVAIDGKITVEFSESMDCDSVESAISTTPYIEYTCIWANDNKTLTLNFSEPLEYDTLYQISISPKAKDLAGRELDEDYEFEFTTAGKPEEKDEEGFPIILLLALLMAIVAAVVIVALVMSKKKKTPAEVVEARVAPIETPQPIQFTCSSCGNLLSVNDIGTTMNVTCPFCSQVLAVQSQRAAPSMPSPQLQSQPSTMKISCPICRYIFEVNKTGGPTRVQCPNCGVAGTMNT
jgi:transcription elongation factor Elf1